MLDTNRQVCLIETDLVLGNTLTETLRKADYSVDWFKNSRDALNKLCDIKYEILICDVNLPDINAQKFFKKLIQLNCCIPATFLITTQSTVKEALYLLKLGARDYLVKPIDLQNLIKKIKHETASSCHDSDNAINYCFGSSDSMHEIEQTIHSLADYPDTTVLISGESGVGKEEIAKRMYSVQLPKGEFVALNCSAIPENLIESELFGHEKGSFTGATRNHNGVFERAHEGILFLDEIGDMPLHMQAKLLRVMQDHQITRVGAENTISVRLRIICATNHNLYNLVQSGRFREDLFYRINTIQLHVPPLRERSEDILLLARNFLNLLNQHHPVIQKHFSDDAKKALLEYPWPGNIRELKNTIERACILSKTPAILRSDLLFDNPLLPSIPQSKKLRDHMKNAERNKINSILQNNNGKIINTADELGISRKSLWEKMRKHGIPTSQ